MPLPDDNTAWPPVLYRPAFHKYAEWHAWFSGSIGDLRGAYGANDYLPLDERVNQQRGGLVGRMQRAFWGRPLEQGETRTVLHVPMAADLARLSSRLLFAEPPVFTVEDTAAQERLDLILNSPDTHMLLNEAGQGTAAYGGTFWTPSWDLALDDHVCLRSHVASSAVPEFTSGRLTAVTLWTRYDRDRMVYRHLERHEVGAIIHGLYKGDSNLLGNAVPLSMIPETAPIAETPGAINDVYQTIIETHMTRLAAAYQPNVRPNPEFMNQGELQWLGRSDYSGIEPVLSALDETWSSWMIDLKAGRSRLFVPEALMKSNGRGRGERWNSEQEVFTLLAAMPNNDATKNIQAEQFAIRVTEHEQTAYNLVKTILRANNYSLSSYGETGDVTQTATEINDRKSDSELTRDEKKRYASAALNYMGSVLLELDGIIFPGSGGKPGLEVTSEFPETSQEDPLKSAQIISLLDAASAISLREKVSRANPGWSDEQIETEVDAIKAEQEQKAEAAAEKVMPSFPIPAFSQPPSQFTEKPVDEGAEESEHAAAVRS